jgi:cytochrome oxidase assembly protein ShyY1
MLGILLVLLAIAAVCARLGVWQLDRAQQSARQAEASEAAAAADAVPLVDVLAPQATFTGAADRRLVVAQGRFGEDEVLVPDREREGEVGLYVVTPFVVADTGATLAVVRGWVATPDDAGAAPAPSGETTVTGVLQVGEPAHEDLDLPAGQVAAVSPAALVNRWGGPVYTGYLVLTDVDPAQGDLAAAPLPEPPSGAWDLQNLAYAAQWWLFGGFAIALWVRLVRDEARRSVEETAADQTAADQTAADGLTPAGDAGESAATP